MLAGRKYRLEFTFGQQAFAERSGGICRAVWNTGLEQRRDYRRRGEWITHAEQCRQLTDAKKDPYCAWLADAPAQVIQQALKDLDQACREHGTGKVRWKSKAKWRPSFRFPTAKHLPVQRIARKWGRVFLPEFGWARFRMSRPLGGTVKSATVSPGRRALVHQLPHRRRDSRAAGACVPSVGGCGPGGRPGRRDLGRGVLRPPPRRNRRCLLNEAPGGEKPWQEGWPRIPQRPAKRNATCGCKEGSPARRRDRSG
ncbi:helix-turn-helix domain-containing protein [Nonomuraea diastatica]|uniref:Transposase putative helix-turn-helix domain-containing protein n=1 Tax=Nonomuraea diastatica TaxID=1848329 RepID=A0A4R4W5J1_9ACTN|nr:hypothetical protein E1294_39560 [Nonomuraea diastatica]